MTRRRLETRAELVVYLEWLRAALRDSRFDARLILSGILDCLELLAALSPGPPAPPGGPPEEEPAP